MTPNKTIWGTVIALALALGIRAVTEHTNELWLVGLGTLGLIIDKANPKSSLKIGIGLALTATTSALLARQNNNVLWLCFPWAIWWISNSKNQSFNIVAPLLALCTLLASDGGENPLKLVGNAALSLSIMAGAGKNRFAVGLTCFILWATPIGLEKNRHHKNIEGLGTNAIVISLILTPGWLPKAAALYASSTVIPTPWKAYSFDQDSHNIPIKRSATAIISNFAIWLGWGLGWLLIKVPPSTRKKILQIGTPVLILAACTVIWQRSTLLESLGRSSDITGRIPLWKANFGWVAERPIGGWKSTIWAQGRDILFMEDFWPGGTSHNFLLQTATTDGVPAAILWAALLTILIVRRQGNFAEGGAIAGYLLNWATVDPPLETRTTANAYLPIGQAGAIPESDSKTKLPKAPSKKIIGILLTACTLWGAGAWWIATNWQAKTEEVWITQRQRKEVLTGPNWLDPAKSLEKRAKELAPSGVKVDRLLGGRTIRVVAKKENQERIRGLESALRSEGWKFLAPPEIRGETLRPTKREVGIIALFPMALFGLYLLGATRRGQILTPTITCTIIIISLFWAYNSTKQREAWTITTWESDQGGTLGYPEHLIQFEDFHLKTTLMRRFLGKEPKERTLTYIGYKQLILQTLKLTDPNRGSNSENKELLEGLIEKAKPIEQQAAQLGYWEGAPKHTQKENSP